MEYQVVESDEGVVTVVVENKDGSTMWIPTDESNSDYQAYLKSLKPEIVEEPVVEEPPAEDPIPETPAA